MVGKSTCGSGATGSKRKRDDADQRQRGHQQRRGDRPANEDFGEIHQLLSACCPRSVRRRIRSADGDARSDVQSRLTVDHHALACIQTLGGDGQVFADWFGLDRTLLGGVIGLDHPDIEAVRTALQRHRRYGHGVLAGRDQDVDVHEFAGP